MKKLFLLFLFPILIMISLVAMNHSGEINPDQTWYSADNPHIITGNIIIRNGYTLTIESGCNIKFDGNYQITIYGSLLANGTESNHIIFTSNQPTPAPGNWKCIYFDQVTSNSELNYCDISYGGSSDGNIYLHETYSRVSISHCTSTYSASDGLHMNHQCFDTISNSTFSHNNGAGIYVTYASNPTITNCIIKFAWIWCK